MKLPCIQVSLECYDGIRISYMKRTCWPVYGGIDVRDADLWLEKRNLAGETLSEEDVTTEVSPDVSGRVILEGSLGYKRPYSGIDYKEIYSWTQTNFY